MIKKQTFIDTLNAIKMGMKTRSEASKQLKELGLDIDWNQTPYLTPLLELLKAAVPDPHDYISWWLFEDLKHDVSWEADGETITVNVDNPGDLYDYLIGPYSRPLPENLPLVDVPERKSDLFRHVRIEEVDFSNHFDAVLDLVEKEEVIVHIAREGEDKFLLLGIKMYEKHFGPMKLVEDEPPKKKEMETVEIEMEAELYDQAQEVVGRVGFTVEQVCEMFLSWCGLYPEDAAAWMEKTLKKQENTSQAPSDEAQD